MVTPDITVWGIGTSRTIRVHWALKELALDYETHPIRTRTPEMESDAFRQVNPRGKIPVLRDGGLKLTESPAIVTYLAETYSTDARHLIPAGGEQRARYFEWLSFICMELDATSLYVLRRHEDLHEIYGDAPQANSTAREYFKRMVDAIAPDVARAPYLLGDDFSGVDILMGSCMNFSDRYHFDLPAELNDYRARISARPAYTQALEANTP